MDEISNIYIDSRYIDIDINKEISDNIDIDKISNRLEFGISNRARYSVFDKECQTEYFSQDKTEVLRRAVLLRGTNVLITEVGNCFLTVHELLSNYFPSGFS